MGRMWRMLAVLVPLGAAGMCLAQTTIWTPNGEEEFGGRAIERATGKPVPGVWVLAIYADALRPAGVYDPVRCTVTELVRSNERGEYVLPYYKGVPPQFLFALGRRYTWTDEPKQVSRDEKLGWFVNEVQIVDGKTQVLGREGPYASEQEALKASRILQDVWLKKFNGSDDEWVREGPGGTPTWSLCPSGKTSGLVGWDAARLAEAELVPDSAAKRDVMDHLRVSLEGWNWQDPEGVRKLERERGQ